MAEPPHAMSNANAERWCWVEPGDTRATLHLRGAWRLTRLHEIEMALQRLALPRQPLQIEGSALDAIDTASALALLMSIERAGIDPRVISVEGFSSSHQRILELVGAHLGECHPQPAPPALSVLGVLGFAVIELTALLKQHLNFLGAATSSLAQLALRPHMLRAKEFSAQLEQVCIRAIPVTSLVTMLIGVVIAYLLGLQAEKYGANIFVVDGVAIGVTRELSPIIVAVIVAGRSGAAFTAQLGSMRLTEEIDAIRTLGLDPMQVVVVPRVLALVVALPLLVFIGDVMSIVGAMFVAGPMLDITPLTFIDRLREELQLKHVVVGLIKAPVFALFIAVIGCRMGLAVERDTRAVGVATTSTVVQSIVSVILLDAAFAVLFQQLDI